MVVAVLGASNKADRYSYKALKMLQEHGHEPLPIHPKLKEIEGATVYCNLTAIDKEVHTLTMYVGPARSATMVDDILALGAKRVIFNPGTENSELQDKLRQHGVEVLEACTLVMLSTGTF